MSRAARVVVRGLDRPGGRALLGRLAARRVRQRSGEACRVRHDPAGYWRYDFADRVVPTPLLTSWQTPAVMEAAARDLFCQEYTPGPGDTVVDVGAGVGWETVLFSRLVGPSGTVVAVEAHPETSRWLDLRCRLNGLENVVRVQAAVADREGVLQISDREDHEANTVLGADDDGVRVPAVTLAALADRYGLTRVDLLKMNIEGAESDALAGLGPLGDLTRHVCVGCHDFLADRTGDGALRTYDDVGRLLTERGFTVTPRRADDERDFARCYLYGTRLAGGGSPEAAAGPTSV